MSNRKDAAIHKSPEWFYQRDGREIGPVTSAEMRRLGVEGAFCRTDLVRKGVGGKWVRAAHVKGLVPVPQTAAEKAASPAANRATAVERAPRGTPGGMETACKPSAQKDSPRRRLPNSDTQVQRKKTWIWVTLAIGIPCITILPIAYLTWSVLTGGPDAELAKPGSYAGPAATSTGDTPVDERSVASDSDGDMSAPQPPAPLASNNESDHEAAKADNVLVALDDTQPEKSATEQPPLDEATPTDGGGAVKPNTDEGQALLADAAPEDTSESKTDTLPPVEAATEEPDTAGDEQRLAAAQRQRVDHQLDLLDRMHSLRQRQQSEGLMLNEQAKGLQGDITKWRNDLSVKEARYTQIPIIVRQLQQERDLARTLLGRAKDTTTQAAMRLQINNVNTNLRRLELEFISLTKVIANLKQSLSTAQVQLVKWLKDFEELQRRDNHLNAQWTDEIDFYGLRPKRFQEDVIAHADRWTADDSEFMAGAILRGFAKIYSGSARDAIGDFDEILDQLNKAQAARQQSFAVLFSRVVNRNWLKTNAAREEAQLQDQFLLIAMAGRGQASAQTGDVKQALEAFGKIIGRNRTFAPGLVLRGQIYANTNKRGSALKDFNAAMKASKGDPAGFRESARIFLESDRETDRTKAVTNAKKACELAGWKDWSSLQVYAAALAAAGDASEARTRFAEALELAPLEKLGRINEQIASLAE